MKKIVTLFAAVSALALSACGPDNAGACTAYIEKVNATYEECDVESTIEDSFCDSYADLDADCTEYFDCLGNAYTCEDDGTVSVDTSGCDGCA